MDDRRPLYLLAERAIEVGFVVPALRVAAADRAPTIHPLCRLSRVLSRGPVAWSGDALAACLEAGVPVVFVDVAGRVRGVLQVSRANPTGLGDYLACAAESPDWPEHYDNWYRAQQRRLILRLCSAVGWPSQDPMPAVMHQRLDRALWRRWQRDPQALLAPYVPCLRTAVSGALAAAGIHPDMTAGTWAGVNLAEDLLALAAWPLRGRLLTGDRPPPSAAAQAIAHYERCLAAAMDRTLARLVRYLWRIPL